MKAIDEVQELLWEGALRIEEGGLAIAERDLREAQEALMEALERDAPDEEIERLMEELQQALNTFLDELVKQMQEPMAQGDPQFSEQALPPDTPLLTRPDLTEMLARARVLAKPAGTATA